MPKKIALEDPLFKKRIYNLVKEGKTYTEIPKIIKSEMGIDLTPQTVTKVYQKYLKQQNQTEVEGTKEKNMDAWEARMYYKLERIDKTINKLMDAIDSLTNNIEPEAYIKIAPTILATCREMLSQAAFLRKEYSDIKNKQKESVLSPLKILEHIRKYEKEKKKKEGKEVVEYVVG